MKRVLLLFIAIFISTFSKAQVPTVQDCPGAIQIYDSVITITSAFSGTGNYPNELNPALSCLNQGEKNDVWLYFDVCGSGLFGFSIQPINPADDYDWAVYDLTNATCADIYNNPALEVSCNYSGVPGNTGPNGLPGSQNEPLLQVISGQRFLISINNFVPNQSGFTVVFINASLKCSGGLIQGNLFFDTDSNCLQAPNEYVFKNQLVQVNPGNHLGFSNVNGEFNFRVDTGQYIVTATNPQYAALACPSGGNYSVSVLSTADSSLNNDFGFEFNESILDLEINATTSNGVRAGEISAIYLQINNQFAFVPIAKVSLTLDTLVSFYAASIPYDSIVNNVVYWHFDTVSFFETKNISISFLCSSAAPLNSVLHFKADVLPIINDTMPLNNTDSVEVTVLGPFDPNEIVVNPIGNGAQHLISPNQKLTYTIYFQNTGTASAINVMVDDILDNALDISTIDLISSSHNFDAKLLSDNRLRFNFYNINLPDSNADEPASHGFVKYSIYPKQNIPFGTVINNSASIVFDLNLPVLTNSVFNTIANPNAVNEISDKNLIAIVYPNPVTGSSWLKFVDAKKGDFSISIFNSIGAKILSEKFSGNSYLISASKFPNGILFFEVADENGSVLQRGRFVVQHQ